ncbi:biopolymer transporter ExbD [Candidatus Peregrinibacteria bacterium]|nr:biopolymer transporter ExbD [Candidatus Peregrinibacteria bacterium]
MEFKKKQRKNTQLDITPIVDTVFNLLIFFALSLNFITPSSMKIQLPKTTTESRTPARTTQIRIQITRDAGMYINKKKTDSFRSLCSELKKIHTRLPGSTVVVEADENVSHGTVVRVMDSCRKSGFNRISIAVQPSYSMF